MFIFKLVKIKFFSPIIFQRNYIETPWRVPSDYIVRALTYAYLRLYDVNEWFKFLDQDIIRLSSLLILRDKVYLPNYGTRGYMSVDGDIIDSSEIVANIPRVRISRVEGIEPTPFEDYQLLTTKYEWGVIIACLLYTSPSPRDRG